jgi:hypothetical protein
MGSLGKRWFEPRSYVGFTDAAAVHLASFRSIAQPHFRRIADEFYALVRCHEGAQSALEDEAQVQRLHESLQVWLGELLGGPYDDAHIARRARIGPVHVHVVLEPPYMIAAIGRVRESLRAGRRR